MKTEFYILNDHDRPEAEMLVYRKTNGCFRYAHPKHRRNKLYQNMTSRSATPVENFGIEISIVGDRVTGAVTSQSIATYSDGRPRKWQGHESFSFQFSKK